MTTVCKTWKSTKFSYLCSHQLFPTASTAGCGICVRPSVPRGVCPASTQGACATTVMLPDRVWFEPTQMTEANSSGEYTIPYVGAAWPGAQFYYKSRPVSQINQQNVLVRDVSMGYANSACVWTNQVNCRRWYKLRAHPQSEASGNQIIDQCPGSTNPFTPTYGYTIYGGIYNAGWSMSFVGGTQNSTPKVRLHAYRSFTVYSRYSVGSNYWYDIWANTLGDIKSARSPYSTVCGGVSSGYGPPFANIYGSGNTLGYGLSFAVWEAEYPCSKPLKSRWVLTKVYSAAEDTSLCSNPGIWPTNIPNTITINVSV